MRDTSILEKLIPSVINASVALILSLPFYFWFGLSVHWKISAILIFYILQVLDTHENLNFQCFGMRILGTCWEKEYSRLQRNLYSIFYTLSFSTFFFYIYFPFDLFIANMLLLQLPAIILSGTTLHGFLAGGLRTKIQNKPNSL